MCSSGEYCTDFFDSKIGVRQEYMLSPNLLKIVINDLPSYFTGSSQPVYSRLSLSRIPRDSLKYFEISVPRHIRIAELWLWSNFSSFPQYFVTCC